MNEKGVEDDTTLNGQSAGKILVHLIVDKWTN